MDESSLSMERVNKFWTFRFVTKLLSKGNCFFIIQQYNSNIYIRSPGWQVMMANLTHLLKLVRLQPDNYGSLSGKSREYLKEKC